MWFARTGACGTNLSRVHVDMQQVKQHTPLRVPAVRHIILQTLSVAAFAVHSSVCPHRFDRSARVGLCCPADFMDKGCGLHLWVLMERGQMPGRWPLASAA